MILNFEIEDYPPTMIKYLNRTNTSEYGKFVRCGWYCHEQSVDGQSPEFAAFLKRASCEEIVRLFQFGWQCEQQVNKTAADNNESPELLKLSLEIETLRQVVKARDIELGQMQRLFSDQSKTFLQAQNDNSVWWKARFDELREITDKTNSRVDQSKDAKIEQLERMLIAKEQLPVFKGQVGEEFVRQILAQACPECEIVNKSKETKCGDLHVINGADEFVAIEVKNKDVITAADVKKSIADILHLKAINPARKFAGYIFASLKTRNIPKKGSLFFESIDGIPVIWVACDNKHELEICLAHYIKLLFHYHANFCTKLDPKHDTIRAAILNLGKLAQKVTRLLGPLDTLRAQILDIDTEMGTIWGELRGATE